MLLSKTPPKRFKASSPSPNFQEHAPGEYVLIDFTERHKTRMSQKSLLLSIVMWHFKTFLIFYDDLASKFLLTQAEARPSYLSPVNVMNFICQTIFHLKVHSHNFEVA